MSIYTRKQKWGSFLYHVWFVDQVYRGAQFGLLLGQAELIVESAHWLLGRFYSLATQILLLSLK